MAAEPDAHTETNGNGDRATIALVNSKVDTVLAETRGGFKDVQRQLDGLATLPTQVSALHERQTLAEARITTLEQRAAESRTYRMGTLPMILLTVAGLCIAGLNIYLAVNA